MTDIDFDEELKYIDASFKLWLDMHDNLLDLPIKESIGNAYFDGYGKGSETVKGKVIEILEHDGKLGEIRETLNLKWVDESELARENEKLKKQIKKMQCCRNCKYFRHNSSGLIDNRKEIMEHCDFNEARKINCCKNYKWELEK